MTIGACYLKTLQHVAFEDDLVPAKLRTRPELLGTVIWLHQASLDAYTLPPS
eukprot:m.82970 g.82970  ORF g.82970 m.82970 type:complete len:52 (+) comp14638_c0_seq16:103-258(+)